MYTVYDNHNKKIKSFTSYQAAFTFKIQMQRYDWKIKS